MAEKRIDLFFLGHNQVGPAARGAARDTEEYSRRVEAMNRRQIEQFQALDRAQRERTRHLAGQRATQELTVQRAELENARRAVALGREGARVELEQLQITRQYTQERRALRAVLASEAATQQQRIAAQRQLNQLEAQHRQQLDRLMVRRLFGDPAGDVRRSNAGIREQRDLAGQAGLAVTRWLGTYVGLAAVGMAIRGTTQAIGEHIAGVVELQRELRELIALGDNAANQGAIRGQVLDLSSLSGRSTRDISDLMFTIQSGSANLDKRVQDQILSSTLLAGEATDARLNEVATALIKSYQIFGDEVKSVADLQDRLFFSAERGMQTYGEMARLLPRVLPASEAFNFTLNETLAALSVGTRIGGKTEETYTAIRNIFLRLNNATKEGLELTGSFADQLEQLNDVDPAILKRIFGDETITLVLTLRDAVAELREEVEKYDNMQPNRLENKYRTTMADDVASYARMMQGFRQEIDNVTKNPENIEGYAGRFAFRRAGAEAHFRSQMGIFGEIGYGNADLANLVSLLGGLDATGKPTVTQLNKDFERALASNNFALAEAIAAKIAEVEGRVVRDDNGRLFASFLSEQQVRVRERREQVAQADRLAAVRDVIRPELLRERFGGLVSPDRLASIERELNLGSTETGSGPRMLEKAEAILAELVRLELDKEQREDRARQETERLERIRPVLERERSLIEESTLRMAGDELGAALVRIERQYAEAMEGVADREILDVLNQRKELEIAEAAERDQERQAGELRRLADLRREVEQRRLESEGRLLEAALIGLHGDLESQLAKAGSPEEARLLAKLNASKAAELREREQQRLDDLELEVRRRELLASGDRLGAELVRIEAEYARRIEDAANAREVELLLRLKGLELGEARGLTAGERRTPDALTIDPQFTAAADRFRQSGVDPVQLAAAEAKRAADQLERDAEERRQRWRELDRKQTSGFDAAHTDQYIDLA